MGFTNNNGDISLGSILTAMQTVQDATAMSLTQYTQQATVNSRVFIDQKIANEEIIAPLLTTQMNLYAGLIMTALSMNNYITGSKRVRDLIAIVSTENYTQNFASNYDLVKAFAGMESYPRLEGVAEDDAAAATGVDALDSGTATTDNTVTEAETSGVDDLQEPDTGEDESDGNTMRSRMYDTNVLNDPDSNGDYGGHHLYSTRNAEYVKDQDKAHDLPLPSGRILNIATNTDCGATVNFNIMLNLNPTFIPPEVMSAFIALNFSPSIRQRYLMLKAGEISTIKDFVFGMDMRRQRFDALRKDKTGALREMIDRQENSRANAWLKLLQIQPNNMNIANTILVYDKYNLDTACSNAGVRLNDFDSRQKFFNMALAMMLVSVDPMYNRIEIYYHGMKNYSQFTFDQVKKASKNDKATDLLQVMKNYASGMAPKF